jgi:hypothetical protein
MKNLVFFVVFLITAMPVFASDKWQERSDREGIRIFSKEIEGNPIIALRGEVDIDMPAAKVATVIVTTERNKEWAPNLIESRLVRQLTPHSRVEYNHTSAPWPLEDRDFVFRSESFFYPEKKTIVFRFKSADEPGFPNYPKVIRGDLEGSFTLTALGPKKSHVELEVLADPKGTVPKWVVNLFQTSWPRRVLFGLRKQSGRGDVSESDEAKTFFEGPAQKVVQPEMQSPPSESGS